MPGTALQAPNYLQAEVAKWVDKIQRLDPSRDGPGQAPGSP